MYAFRVSDRFGDSGLTGVLGLSARDDEVYVEDFVLSCRVFGKQIEEVMLAQASALAGSRRLIFDYIETARNGPCRRFLDKGHLEKKRLTVCQEQWATFPVSRSRFGCA